MLVTPEPCASRKQRVVSESSWPANEFIESKRLLAHAVYIQTAINSIAKTTSLLNSAIASQAKPFLAVRLSTAAQPGALQRL
jgi:hypothetical protein